MPGVGKTQLALAYAHHHRPDYAAGLWVSATSPESLIAGFTALAHILNLPERNEADQAKIVTAVRRWLAATEQPWLLILDNADELEGVQEFLPSGRGHCLLTTRAQGVRALAAPVPLDEMEPDEGTLLLLRRAGHLAADAPLESASPKEREQATALARELDGLPLALDQIGAFAEETGVSLVEYLHLYRTEGKRLRERRGQLHLEHPSIAVTFTLAFEEVAKLNPATVELLRACAFLDPDAIPEELLVEGAPEWGEPLVTVLTDPLARAELIATLNCFSLVARDPDTHTLTLHRVVQAALRDELDEDSQRLWAERAVRVVARGFPNPQEFSAWPQCERLLPQAQTAADWIEQWNFAFEEGGCLLNNTAGYLHERARYTEVELLHQRALAIWKRALGPDHPDIAQSLNNLAFLYHTQGRFAEAEPLFQRALTIRERALGPDHPLVAQSLNNLDLLYRTQGRLAEAEPLCQRALTIQECALGPDHPDIALSLNNLASLHHDQGRFAEAEPLFQRILAIQERTLDPNHPDFAITLNDLATLYHDQGRFTEAEPLYQRALTIQEHSIGPDHPHIAASFNNLASLYSKQDRFAEAESLHQRARAIVEQSLGPDHPDVAISLNNLAGLYYAQGRFTEAEPLFERALAIKVQALGPDHPHVALALENYAVLLEQTGRSDEAAPLRERAQDIRARHTKANPST